MKCCVLLPGLLQFNLFPVSERGLNGKRSAVPELLFQSRSLCCTLRAGREKGCDRERNGREVLRKLQVAGVSQFVVSMTFSSMEHKSTSRGRSLVLFRSAVMAISPHQDFFLVKMILKYSN